MRDPFPVRPRGEPDPGPWWARIFWLCLLLAILLFTLAVLFT